MTVLLDELAGYTEPTRARILIEAGAVRSHGETLTIRLSPCASRLLAGRRHNAARLFVAALERGDLTAAAAILARSPSLSVGCPTSGILSVCRGCWCLVSVSWPGAPDRGGASGRGKRLLVEALRRASTEGEL